MLGGKKTHPNSIFHYICLNDSHRRPKRGKKSEEKRMFIAGVRGGDGSGKGGEEKENNNVTVKRLLHRDKT